MKNKLNAVFSELFSVNFFLARKRPVNLIYIQRHDLSLALELRKSRRDKFRSVFLCVFDQLAFSRRCSGSKHHDRKGELEAGQNVCTFFWGGGEIVRNLTLVRSPIAIMPNLKCT